MIGIHEIVTTTRGSGATSIYYVVRYSAPSVSPESYTELMWTWSVTCPRSIYVVGVF